MDPVLGVFLSVDPVTAWSSPVTAFNRYRYANNNPYRFTDPHGCSAREEAERKPVSELKPEQKRPEPKILATVSVTATRSTPAPTNASIPWARIGGFIGSRVVRPVSLLWPTPIAVSACENEGPGACARLHSESTPAESDLTKVKERDGNKVAQNTGYDDAHDAKKGRGQAVSIFIEMKLGESIGCGTAFQLEIRRSSDGL
ncbi:MAG: hypothetical protein JHC82_01700 [Stenotrophomonas sp.]|nr:hypothetical protein [Stenotrophomonas sp.]